MNPYTDNQLRRIQKILHDIVLKTPSYEGSTSGWDCSFRGSSYGDDVPPQVEFFNTYWTVEYSDSGVGEDYVVGALRQKWPEYRPEIEYDGGCDSCGFGRRLIITLHGVDPPWGEIPNA